MARRLLLVAGLLVAATLVPATPASAAIVVENFNVPTVDGKTIRVEVRRDPALDPQPVILTYSPYNTLSEPEPTDDAYAARYNPLGYARAVADVLGTRGSTGCWDYGGLKEQQSGVDVVNALANAPWSTGKVVMIGGSYDGTTANMVAARGADAPGLVGIVPIAAISHWYGYAYGNGVRYFLNSQNPADEGFDTPLAFDYGLNRTVAPDPDDPAFVASLQGRFVACEFQSVEHTQHGYSRQADYDQFWRERSYRKDAGNFRAAVLLAHGWQDYNVKQEETIALWNALRVDDSRTAAVEGVPFKVLYMTQGTHSGGSSGAEWQPLLDRFLEHVLKGVNNGIDRDPVKVITRGRTLTNAGAVTNLDPSFERDWPPPGTKPLDLYISRTFDEDVPGAPPPGTGETGVLSTDERPSEAPSFVYVDNGAVTEEASLRDATNEPGHGYYSLYYRTEPLTRPLRIAGSAVFDVWVRGADGQHLTPLLVDRLPNGELRLIERGFLNLNYRNGLERSQPLRPGEWGHARVEFLPQDFTVPAGHSIGLIIQSSNTVWAVPGTPGQVNIAHGRVPNTETTTGRLTLPVVGGAGKGLFAGRCKGKSVTLLGTNGKDKLVGTKKRDVISALGGRDRIRARRGRDIVCAGKGKDRIRGGAQRDILLGGKGKDTFRASGPHGGPSRLQPGKARGDLCRGGPGRDRGRSCERGKL